MIPLRIVHVLAASALRWPAGASALLAWLERQGHAVAAVAVGEGVAVPHPLLGQRTGWWSWWRRGARDAAAAAAAWGCDLVHAHGEEALGPAADLARRLGVALVADLPCLPRPVQRRLLRAPACSAVLVASEFHRSLLVARDAALRPRVQVLPPGLPLPELPPRPAPGPQPLAIACWLRRRHDLALMARIDGALAAGGLARRWLVLAEDGLAAALSEGWRAREPAELLAADVLLEPCEADLPMPHIVAALAHGLPVVGAAAGQLLELVDDGDSGFLVPAGDAEAMAGALRQLADRERRAAFAAIARRLAARHDIAIVGEAALAAYRAAIAGCRRPVGSETSWRRLSSLRLEGGAGPGRRG